MNGAVFGVRTERSDSQPTLFTWKLTFASGRLGVVLGHLNQSSSIDL